MRAAYTEAAFGQGHIEDVESNKNTESSVDNGDNEGDQEPPPSDNDVNVVEFEYEDPPSDNEGTQLFAMTDAPQWKKIPLRRLAKFDFDECV